MWRLILGGRMLGVGLEGDEGGGEVGGGGGSVKMRGDLLFSYI